MSKIEVELPEFLQLRLIKEASHLGILKGPEDLSEEENALIKKVYNEIKATGTVSPKMKAMAILFGYDTED